MITEQEIIGKTKRQLINAVKNCKINSKTIAVSFSGGLDSSLIAFILKRFTNFKVKLYTIGIKNCRDMKVAPEVAEKLGLPLESIVIDKEEVEDAYSKYLESFDDSNKVSISYTLPLFMLMKYIKESEIVTGHGADTLFGGFYKYLDSKELKKDISRNYNDFLKKLPIREIKIAKFYNKKIYFPFADNKLSEYVLSLPEKYFIKDDTRKYLLRKIALSLNMDKDIVNAPKKAFQYSSGIIKYLKKIW